LDNENANSVEENRTSLIKLIAYTIPFYEQRKTSKGII
jgi:hypothetical protein